MLCLAVERYLCAAISPPLGPPSRPPACTAAAPALTGGAVRLVLHSWLVPAPEADPGWPRRELLFLTGALAAGAGFRRPGPSWMLSVGRVTAVRPAGLHRLRAGSGGRRAWRAVGLGLTADLCVPVRQRCLFTAGYGAGGSADGPPGRPADAAWLRWPSVAGAAVAAHACPPGRRWPSHCCFETAGRCPVGFFAAAPDGSFGGGKRLLREAALDIRPAHGRDCPTSTGQPGSGGHRSAELCDSMSRTPGRSSRGESRYRHLRPGGVERACRRCALVRICAGSGSTPATF
ncbi:MAG: hypothetical protein ACLU38_11800 [Dysosmobacter sp.]